MIVAADWVIPVSGPPIPGGAVFIRGREIGEVGPLGALTARHPDVPVRSHPGCVIVPGLVNAHTHLSFTALAGLLPPSDFASWLMQLAAYLRALTHDDLVTSASVGAIDCLLTGATVVGDISIGPEDISAAGDHGLGGVFAWEVHGVAAAEVRTSLSRREFPEDNSAISGEGRLRCGLAPQAPYACGPGLIKIAGDLAGARDCPMMMHLGESSAEMRLLASGTGALAPFASRWAHGFEAPGMGAIAYVDSLGVLANTIAVHCVYLTSGESRLLAAKSRGVVLCPGANHYMRHGTAPVAEIRASGALMAIGTDSLANNTATDLFAEARRLRQLDPGLSAGRLLEMLTIEGATVLGLESLFGTLEAGKQADLAVIEVGSTRDPIERLIDAGSPERVVAVMSLGAWRVLEGQPTVVTTRLRQENGAVTAKLLASRDRAARTAEQETPRE